MEPFTFDQLPHAVGLLHDKLMTIEQLLRDRAAPSPVPDELLTISEAAKFLNLSVPTLYSKVSRREVPVNKQGKRLYFYKSELADWIKAGRKKTASEINQEAERYATAGRKGSRK
jgi:excisionase family DNA binding protein